MIASYQAGPIIYKYLMDKKGVKSVAFVARNESDPLNQRNEGVEAAKKLGLKVRLGEDTYEPGTTDFFPVMSKVVGGKPDLIVLSGVAPADAPLLIRAARELGYPGHCSAPRPRRTSRSSRRARATPPTASSRSAAPARPRSAAPTWRTSPSSYTKVAGEWNDEAGTKVYALEIILATLQKTGKAAIDNVETFKKAIADFAMKNPFLKERQAAHLRRHRLLRPEAADRRADGGERVPGRQVQDAVRRQRRIGAGCHRVGRQARASRCPGSRGRQSLVDREAPAMDRSSSTAWCCRPHYALIALGITLIFRS